MLAKDGSVDDLLTREVDGDFELERKLDKGGNSGIVYRGTRDYDHIHWSAPEYQLLDDANAHDGQARLTSAAAAYGLYAAPAGSVLPHDEWNRMRIIVRRAHLAHGLNGQKVVDYELVSDDWTSKAAPSEVAVYPLYGLAKSGVSGIQGDHDGALSIRRMRICTLR